MKRFIQVHLAAVLLVMTVASVSTPTQAIAVQNATNIATVTATLIATASSPSPLPISKPQHIFTGFHGSVRSVAFSPDNKTILTSDSNDAILWNVVTGAKLRTFHGHPDWVVSLAFSPDGKYVLTGSLDKTAILWNTTTGTKVRTFTGSPDAISVVAYSPDGKSIVTASALSSTNNNGQAIIQWDANSGHQLQTIPVDSGQVSSMVFSPDGKYLLAVVNEATLYDLASGKPIQKYIREDVGTTAITAAISPDGKYVLVAFADTSAALYDTMTGKQLQQFYYSGSDVYVIANNTNPVMDVVAFSPDGQQVVTGDGNGNVILWDTVTTTPLRIFNGHKDAIMSVTFSPDGKYILTGGNDLQAILWKVN